MKWNCPTCGQKWSIPDIDRSKWEGKTRCPRCPPVRRKIRLPKIDIKPPQENLEPLEEISSDFSKDKDDSQEDISDFKAKDNDFVQEDVSGFKAFVPDSDKLGDVTADTEKKIFREKGYEGKKKSSQRKRGRKKE